MNVEVRFAGEKAREMAVDLGAHVLDILKQLGVGREVVAVRLDGKLVPEEEPLQDGSKVEIFRIVTGG